MYASSNLCIRQSQNEQVKIKQIVSYSLFCILNELSQVRERQPVTKSFTNETPVYNMSIVVLTMQLGDNDISSSGAGSALKNNPSGKTGSLEYKK